MHFAEGITIIAILLYLISSIFISSYCTLHTFTILKMIARINSTASESVTF